MELDLLNPCNSRIQPRLAFGLMNVGRREPES